MNIIYNSYILQKITGSREESISIEKTSSIANLIELLSIKYGTKFKNLMLDKENKKLKMLVLVNGSTITDVDYKIADADTVNILSFITGG